MKFGYEEILMVVIAFLIGWFLKTMISGSSLGSGSSVKVSGGKHEWGDPSCGLDNNGNIHECAAGYYCDISQGSKYEGRCAPDGTPPSGPWAR